MDVIGGRLPAGSGGDEAESSSAAAAHAAHRGAVAASFEPLVAMGSDILKAAALINGTAAASSVLVLAAAIRADRALALALVPSLATFGFGLTVAAFAIGWSYLAQASQAAALEGQALAPSPPFIVDTPASLAAAGRARRFQRLALGAVLVAMASAVAGFTFAGVALLAFLR